MCTSIALRSGDCYFGRTLDIDSSYGEKVVVTPRQYHFHLKNGTEYITTYALMGIGIVADDLPFYYEAFNERGLGMAGLNFAKSAVYHPMKPGAENIAVFELLPWILGQAGTVAEARELLSKVNLIREGYSREMPSAPLHFMLTDRLESIVVEPMTDGLVIHDNPYDVMTNEPPFPMQTWNLRQYRNLSPENRPSSFARDYKLENFSMGMGAVGLPGDASSMSRFVRAAFHLANVTHGSSEETNVGQFFHVMDSVTMIKGTVLTGSGKSDLTTYTCCANLSKGIFYYKTYENSQITALQMDHANLDGDQLTVYPLNKTQQIRYDN